MMIHAMVPLALITTLDLTPAPAHAQQATGWQAWYGCWAVVGEASAGDVVCMLPGASAAQLRMLTVTDGMVADEVVLHADGAPRPVEEGGCTGTTTAEWSRDGRRLFVGTDLDCDGYRRLSRGALVMLSETEWVDVQAAAIFDQHLTRTLRYRAVTAEGLPAALRAQLDETQRLVRQTARVAAAAPMSPDDVVEASGRMPAPALQTLLTLRGSPFRLNGRDLVHLADAGVPGDVIDVMVALSHPQQFAIRQPESAGTPGAAPGYARMQECYDPMFGRVLYGMECDSPWAMSLYGRYGSRYRYSPWSYDPWRSRGGTTVIVVEPRVPETPSVPRQPSQLLRGSGYSRGTAESTGSAQPRPAAGSSAGSAAAGSTAGASATTSSGSTGASTSSGTSTGRTAQPRNNGNGGGGQ